MQYDRIDIDTGLIKALYFTDDAVHLKLKTGREVVWRERKGSMMTRLPSNELITYREFDACELLQATNKGADVFNAQSICRDAALALQALGTPAAEANSRVEAARLKMGGTKFNVENLTKVALENNA